MAIIQGDLKDTKENKETKTQETYRSLGTEDISDEAAKDFQQYTQYSQLVPKNSLTVPLAKPVIPISIAVDNPKASTPSNVGGNDVKYNREFIGRNDLKEDIRIDGRDSFTIYGGDSSSESYFEALIEGMEAQVVTNVTIVGQVKRNKEFIQFLISLKDNHSLLRLTIKSIKIGEAGVELIADAMKNSLSLSLQQLVLDDVYFTDTCAKYLADALKVNFSLQQLEIISSDIYEGWWEGELSKETLQENGKYIFTDEGVKLIAESLKTHNSLEQLRLGIISLYAPSAQYLAELLKTNHSLTRLDVSFNTFEDAGAEHLAIGLMHNQTLQELNLNRTDIGDLGVVHLAKALKINNSLQKLDLRDNLLGEIAAVALAEALKDNKSLKRLNLRMTKLDSDCVSRNSKRAPEGAAPAVKRLAEALKENKSLEELDLSFNYLGPTGAIYLAEALKINQGLKQLLIYGCKLGNDGVKCIADALKENQTLQHLNIICNDLDEDGLNYFVDALKTKNSLRLYITDIRVHGNHDAEHHFASDLKEIWSLKKWYLSDDVRKALELEEMQKKLAQEQEERLKASASYNKFQLQSELKQGLETLRPQQGKQNSQQSQSEVKVKLEVKQQAGGSRDKSSIDTKKPEDKKKVSMRMARTTLQASSSNLKPLGFSGKPILIGIAEKDIEMDKDVKMSAESKQSIEVDSVEKAKNELNEKLQKVKKAAELFNIEVLHKRNKGTEKMPSFLQYLFYRLYMLKLAPVVYNEQGIKSIPYIGEKIWTLLFGAEKDYSAYLSYVQKKDQKYFKTFDNNYEEGYYNLIDCVTSLDEILKEIAKADVEKINTLELDFKSIPLLGEELRKKLLEQPKPKAVMPEHAPESSEKLNSNAKSVHSNVVEKSIPIKPVVSEGIPSSSVHTSVTSAVHSENLIKNSPVSPISIVQLEKQSLVQPVQEGGVAGVTPIQTKQKEGQPSPQRIFPKQIEGLSASAQEFLPSLQLDQISLNNGTNAQNSRPNPITFLQAFSNYSSGASVSVQSVQSVQSLPINGVSSAQGIYQPNGISQPGNFSAMPLQMPPQSHQPVLPRQPKLQQVVSQSYLAMLETNGTAAMVSVPMNKANNVSAQSVSEIRSSHNGIARPSRTARSRGTRPRGTARSRGTARPKKL